MLLKLIGHWRRPRPQALRTVDHVVHDREAFRTLVAKERARSDRSGRVFSLLTFVPRDAASAGSFHNVLLQVLQHRIRFTDEIGWLDDRWLAVLLPDTPGEGAWKLADDVQMQLADLPSPPLCEVFEYPQPGDRSPDPEELAPEEQDPEESNPEENGHSTSDGSHGTRALAGHRKNRQPVSDMGVFWIQKLPWWKRCVDVMGAAFGLGLAAPVLAAAALAIRWNSPGPVFFVQRRAGLGGKPFRMFKLRTMVDGADQRVTELRARSEQDGPAFKMKNDPRVTRVGEFLRRTSIDELPQLWNVLKGEMSLVGPRPLPCDEAAACTGWQQARTWVTPGLTCFWQTEGRSQVPFVEWVRMDLRYVRRRSFWTDVGLLLRTIPAVLSRRGAH